MPKKTKRQKMAAEFHRSMRPAPTSPEVLPSYQYKAHSTPVRHEAQQTDIRSIQRDLLKTITLAAIAIAGEFALFWFWNR